MTIHPLALWSVVGLLLLAVFVSVVCVWRFRQMRRLVAGCASWVQTDATVSAHHIEEVRAGDDISFQPVVIYDYTVGGETYCADQLSIGPPRLYSFKRGAKRVLARYPIGTQIHAWVDPSEPYQAVLDRRTPFTTVLTICFVVLWIVTLGGVGVLLFSPGVVGADPALRW